MLQNRCIQTHTHDYIISQPLSGLRQNKLRFSQDINKGIDSFSRLDNSLAQCTPPTQTRLSGQVVTSVSEVWTQFATSSRRLPTDSVDSLETDQTDCIAVWLREFCSILVTFSTMTSLRRHSWPTLIAQQHRIILNWVTTDGCVHTADTTQRDFAVGKFVETRWHCCQLAVNCVHTTDASAACIGHYKQHETPTDTRAAMHWSQLTQLSPDKHLIFVNTPNKRH